MCTVSAVLFMSRVKLYQPWLNAWHASGVPAVQCQQQQGASVQSSTWSGIGRVPKVDKRGDDDDGDEMYERIEGDGRWNRRCHCCVEHMEWNEGERKQPATSKLGGCISWSSFPLCPSYNLDIHIVFDQIWKVLQSEPSGQFQGFVNCFYGVSAGRWADTTAAQQPVKKNIARGTSKKT